MHWDWLAIGLALGIIFGKFQERFYGKFQKRYWQQMKQEAMMPLARNRPTIDDFFDQDSAGGPGWEDEYTGKVISDRGWKEAT